MATITCNPGDNLVTKVSGGAANDTVIINAGEYRTTGIIIPKAGMTITGAGRDVVKINTSQLLSGFTGSSPRWSLTVSGGITASLLAANQMTNGLLYPQSQYLETVYVRATTDAISVPSQPLWKVGVVTSTGTVVGAAATNVGTTGSTPAGYIGTCHINYQTGVVTISVNPSGKTIELSVTRTAVINCTANDVEVSGVTLCGSSNGRGITANGGARCYFHDGRSYNNLIGVTLAGGLTQTSSPAASATNHNGLCQNWETLYNGQYGGNSPVDYITYDTVKFNFNNHLRLMTPTGAFDASGGIKCTHGGWPADANSGVKFLTCTFEDNWASGCWLDIDCMNWEIDSCIAQRNFSNGFHIEISYAGTFTNNYSYDNTDDGVWVSTSRDGFYYNNYVSGNGRYQFRILDAGARGNGAWGTYRGIGNTVGGTAALQKNFFWHEGAAQFGMQGNAPVDNQVYTTNEFVANKHYLPSPEPAAASGLFIYYNSGGVRTNFAGWKSAGFDVGQTAGTVGVTQRPPAGGVIDPPVAPTITATSGGNALAQGGHTSELDVTLTFSATGATSYQANIDSAGYATATSPLALTTLSYGNHSVLVRGVNDAGTGPAATFSWVVDAPSAPTITAAVGTAPLVSGGQTQAGSVTFTYGSSSGASGYQISLDGAAYAVGTSPTSYSGLSTASHTFAARGTNASGVGGSATFAWTIVAGTVTPTAPGAPTVTAVVNGQTFPTGGTTTVGSAVFTFSSSGATSYQRSLDGAAYGTVTSPGTVTSLSTAAHTYAVKAVNSAGTSTATTFSWTVVPPLPVAPSLSATVGGNPLFSGGTTTLNTISFAFSATNATSYQTSRDDGAFVTTTSPLALSGLALGAHTLDVLGVNTGGTGPTTSFSWTIIQVLPAYYRAGGDGRVAGQGFNIRTQTQGGSA